jgi:hypothetical protein
MPQWCKLRLVKFYNIGNRVKRKNTDQHASLLGLVLTTVANFITLLTLGSMLLNIFFLTYEFAR